MIAVFAMATNAAAQTIYQCRSAAGHVMLQDAPSLSVLTHSSVQIQQAAEARTASRCTNIQVSV
ncbi:hypothetical protein AWV79_38000 [Cupriavidus sp. UYMMa02A]|nr:hypothetical protein AWV79_38000 [Cupriavidus sp. UYMMa02A]